MSSLLLTTLDTGNTAWMIMATILVLLMSIPGIALFYGGLVRQKNILSILMQTVFIVAVVSLIWVAFGYSWAFSTEYADSGNPLACVIGGFDKCFLHASAWMPSCQQVFRTHLCNVPVHVRPHYSSLDSRCLCRACQVQRICTFHHPLGHHRLSSNGPLGMGRRFPAGDGSIDFAGGTVVHINAGVAALVMALCVGKRDDYRAGHPITPHNITFVFMGMSFLWLGWFGFNAGSGLAADGLAANAFFVTHIATAAAATTWMLIDWIVNKKPTTVGACTGAVAGLVAITPAAGSTDIFGAFCIGIISTIVCFFMVAVVKEKFKYDDALDAFGVHGMGGILGSILTGVFATQYVTGAEGVQGALYGDWHQLWVQVVATVVSIIYSVVVTYIIFKVVDKSVGVRVDKRVEEEGLDIYEHGESAYSN